MINMLLLFMVMMSIIFLKSKIPHIMIISLLVSTIFCALLLGVAKSFPWFAYILFLIFFGGVLVLFTYVSGLSSNLLFTGTNVKLYYICTAAAFSALLVVFNLPLTESAASPYTSISFDFLVKELFSPLTHLIYLYLFGYLLITLVYVVLMMKTYYAPLRNLK